MAEWSKAADCNSVRYTLSLVRTQPFSFLKRTKFSRSRFIFLDKEFPGARLFRVNKARWLSPKRFISQNREYGLFSKFFKQATYSAFLGERQFFIFLLGKFRYVSPLLRGFLFGSQSKNSTFFLLNLDHKRRRFFPHFSNILEKKTLFNSSLGIIARYFSNKKSFMRSKASFILSASYVRRILTYIGCPSLRLGVRGTPKHLMDIINILLSPANVFYKNPYKRGDMVNEAITRPLLTFTYVLFLSNKPFGPKKVRKKGRLKRKIWKKIRIANQLLD